MNELGVEGKLIATEITSASPAFHVADTGVIVPRVGKLDYIDALLEAVREYRVGLLVPLTDLDLRSLARHKQSFAELGCDVMVGSEDTILLCRDKARFNRSLEAAGLASIHTCTLAEFLDGPFYPCFVKPIRGSAGVGTGKISNSNELKAHVATFGELLLVQEYVSGREYTIDVYRSRSGEVKCVVPRQRLAVRSGEVEKGVTVRDDTLIESTIRLANVLEDLCGVFCCQCRRGENGPPRFFEVNPRFGGGAPLSIAAGANLPLYLLQDVLSQPITGRIGNFTHNFMMLRYDDAVFVQVDDVQSLPGYDTPQFR